jgi:hypothetical protein
MILVFDYEAPQPTCTPWYALHSERLARSAEDRGQWNSAAELWRVACRAWQAVGEHARAEWCLHRAVTAEREMDTNFRRLRQLGQVLTMRAGERP